MDNNHKDTNNNQGKANYRQSGDTSLALFLVKSSKGVTR